MLEKSWRVVTEATIQHCFYYKGLSKSVAEKSAEENEDLPIVRENRIKKHGTTNFSEIG